jgi:hypothetical protein
MTKRFYPFPDEFGDGGEEFLSEISSIGNTGQVCPGDLDFIIGPPGKNGNPGAPGAPGAPGLSSGVAETVVSGDAVLVAPTQIVICLPDFGASQITLMAAASMLQIVNSLTYAFTVVVINLSGFDLTIVPDPFTTDTLNGHASFTIPSYGNGSVTLVPYSGGWAII